MIDHDAELEAYDPHLRAGAAVKPGERVLDVGCGAGRTTRDAGRAAAPGEVLGIDVSAPALALARERTDLANVTYEQGDVQMHPFTPGRFDLAISRFGTMFFSDPVAAFTNVGRALRSGGRLAMLVWQQRDRNEWALALDIAPGPYSLGDADATERILEAAGFADIGFEDVREPVFFGPDVDEALAFVRPFAGALPAGRLRETVAAHAGENGVTFGARAWLVTARRVRPPGAAGDAAR
jgi:SAM-dependent methyltransferase